MKDEIDAAAAQDNTATAGDSAEPPVVDKGESGAAAAPVDSNDPFAAMANAEKGEAEKAAQPDDKNLLAPDEQKTEGETGEDEKNEDDGAAGDKPADSYEPFKLPDGFVEDPEVMGMFTEAAHKNGIKQEQAQELINTYAAIEAKKAAQSVESLAKNNDDWLREISNHPEFGGRNLPGTANRVQALIRKFGSPLMTAQTRQMNIQNWPEMFYMLARIQKSMGEDSSPTGGKGAPEKNTADLLFGDDD